MLTAAATLTGSIGAWVPIAAALDLVDGSRRMPRLRLLSFALGWSALESVGVGVSTALWAVGRADDVEAHVALQRWWAARLVDTLQRTVDLRFEVDDIEALTPGPIVMCSQHVSMPDALIPAWLLGQVGMRPRFVMKADLQLDPCLDIVGNRLPNHFVDRDPEDSESELALLEELAVGAGSDDACVIFPEGMIVTDAGRERAKSRIEARNPDRMALVGPLQILGPVRPSGTAALLRGAPDADLVLVTHVGLESLQRLANAPARIPFDSPIRINVTRISRSDIPDGDEFTPWLDARWAECDRSLVSRAGTVDLEPGTTSGGLHAPG
ncbi:MAG: 1-acyl-sn-glycerol-3-phosphate acyltransferase [Acidimicrobiales bacterium]|nr:1-acyl-sn-glycerol-3-phosphate acyltransferase [Acidimicrobiales bacterium]